MIIVNGTVFNDDGIFRKIDVETQSGVITALGEKLPKSSHEIINAEDCYVIPGLIDIHTHGAMGVDFSDGTPEAIEIIAKHQLSHGITSFLGTTMSLPEELQTNACKTAKPMINNDYPDQAVIRGIHLEGPFFCHEKRGAQNPEYIIPADVDMFHRWNEASGEAVRLIAVAPEVEDNQEFIKAIAPVCTVSLAHSTADYKTAVSGFANGATHVTHLFNGMNAFNHREPGIIGAAFDSDAYVELIADGVHIHPTMVRAVFELFSEDRVCIISDSMCATGLKDGTYILGGMRVTVVGKSATIDNGSLAGSVASLSDCMRCAVEFGVPLHKAVKAVTINPARSVGLDTEVGSLSIGKRADILVLSKDLEIKHTIFGGNII